MRPRLVLLAVLPAIVLAAAACASQRAGGTAAGEETRSAGARSWAPAADPLASLPAGGPVARYAGPFARDPLVLAFQREAPALLADATARLRAETGLAFVEGRAPVVVVADGLDTPADGAAALRLADGVRRPEIRVRAASVAAGEFRAREHLAALVAESAVLASSPERAPPEWVLRGLPPVFAEDVDRRAAALLLGGPQVRDDVETLAPLESAFRVAALRRIGVGVQVLARFLEARLAGQGDAAALREVGVGSMDFLDAASATEAARTLDRVTGESGVRALARVRAALSIGDASSAESALSDLPLGGGEDAVLDAEIRLVRAETALLRGDAAAAVSILDDVLARPGTVLRLRDARFLRALAALRTDDPAARDRAAVFARTCLDDPRTPSILTDLGVSTQAAFDLASSEAGVRARAAATLGGPDTPQAAAYLRTCLRDGDAGVRRSVVASLARIGGAGVLRDLDAACDDSDASVRATALQALGAADPATGLRRARDLGGDSDPGVRRVAEELVAKATPKPVPPTPKPEPAKSAAAEGPKPSNAPPNATKPTPGVPPKGPATERPIEPPDSPPPPPPPARSSAPAVVKPPAPAAGPAPAAKTPAPAADPPVTTERPPPKPPAPLPPPSGTAPGPTPPQKLPAPRQPDPAPPPPPPPAKK